MLSHLPQTPGTVAGAGVAERRAPVHLRGGPHVERPL